MLTGFRILDPGWQTTIQDEGRPRLRRFGIPCSGALDQFSLQVSNLLVGNRPGAAGLETVLQGLCLEAVGSVIVAVTGGDLSAEWNGQPAPLWTSFRMASGDRLRFRCHQNGCRACVALRGGVAAPQYLGSCSTFARGGMWRNLQRGDLLPANDPAPLSPWSQMRSLAPALRPRPTSDYRVRVIIGPHQDRFTHDGLHTFLTARYRISSRSDRQGFRTEGPPVATTHGSDIISDPTPVGSVQVPGDGQPIILLRDGQTTGGYARIAAVISSDLDQFGRMMPADTVRFESVSREAALDAAARRRRLLRYLTAAFAD